MANLHGQDVAQASRAPVGRVVIGVSLVWIFLGLVWAAQTTMGAILRGVAPVPLASAIRTTLVQTLPWIPVTLAAIALTTRFPLSRPTWKRHLIAHVIAVAVLAFVANILVVLGYWVNAGIFNGVGTLMSQGLLWATVNFHVALLIYVSVVAITHAMLYYQEPARRSS